MAYFGDATAHAAILGVAFALGFQVSVVIGVLGVAVGMALLIHFLSAKEQAIDTLLGVFSHAGLALGLVAVSLTKGVRVDLDAFLFGDVLTAGRTDLALIWGGVVVVFGVLIWRWQGMLTATLDADLAYASGINPRREHLILLLLLAGIVAVSIKVVGALLITALLIIPAASARYLAKNPEGMALLAVIIAGMSALGGVQAALIFDTPVGPTIVCVAACLFGIGGVIKRVR